MGNTKTKGYTLIEVLIVAILIGLLTYSFVEVLKGGADRSKKIETEVVFRNLDFALKVHMREVFNHRRENSWELASDCTYERTWTLPNGCFSDNDYLYLWKNPKICNCPLDTPFS